MKPIWISLLGALTLAARGGNSSDDPNSQATVEVQFYGANPVSVWNEIAFTAVSTTPAANSDLATVHLAMYDAAIAIAGTHQPYAIRPTTSTTGLGAVAMQAAAIEAAYRVLLGLAPAGNASYETARSSGLMALADGDAKTRGTAIGAEVAAGMLALRPTTDATPCCRPMCLVPDSGSSATSTRFFASCLPFGHSRPRTMPSSALQGHRRLAAWPTLPTSTKPRPWLRPTARSARLHKPRWRASIPRHLGPSGPATCGSLRPRARIWRTTPASAR